jgi:hypothetical protein
MKAPYEVDAINNEFEVLALFLGIADEDDHERSQIEVLAENEGINKFKYNGETYSVARQQRLIGLITAYRYFNSSWYALRKEENK